MVTPVIRWRQQDITGKITCTLATCPSGRDLLDREQPSMSKRPKDPHGKSLVLKRTVTVGAHKTGVGLENAFWVALKDIAAAQSTLVWQLVEAIDSERRERQHTNLSSAIRLFVLDYYRSRCHR
jgi:predicted DNA-binding ribbon-helix-helix protein